MRKIFVIILITIISNQAFSQLYDGYKGWYRFFVEFKNDSAHIEIFSNSPPDFVYKVCDEMIIANTASRDTCLKGKQIKILNRRHAYFLLFKPDNRKTEFKIKLKLCLNDNRKCFRYDAYSSKKRIDIMRMQDSLSGPEIFINLDVNNTIRRISNDCIADCNYLETVDKVSDSLTNILLKINNPIVKYYYNASDSIEQIDTAEVFRLLANANYIFPYAKFFLNKIALNRPACLIQYVDKDPVNKKSLLLAIRDHNNYREIIKNVKKTPMTSAGKKEIQKQKSKRVMTDIAVKTVYASIILCEVALLTGVIIWIF